MLKELALRGHAARHQSMKYSLQSIQPACYGKIECPHPNMGSPPVNQRILGQKADIYSYSSDGAWCADDQMGRSPIEVLLLKAGSDPAVVQAPKDRRMLGNFRAWLSNTSRTARDKT